MKLKKLFGSNTRVLLLKKFLLNPGQSFYARELDREFGLGINAVVRELKNLKQLNLIKRNNKKGGLRRIFYRSNAESPLVEKLRKIVQ